MEYEIERRASFDKKSGIVQLSSTHIVWTPDSAADGAELRISFAGVRGYQVTNATAKKAMIRIESAERAAPVKFDFGTSFGDRDAIRDVLSRRLTPAGAASAARAAIQGPASADARPASASSAPLAKPKPVLDWKSLTVEERKWRELLFRKKEVFSLYRNVVESHIIDDETFWKGMKCKYKPNGQRRGSTAADAEDKLDEIGADKGIPSAAFDNQTDCGSDDTGEQWIGDLPNAGERHRIFMDFPAVSLAYRAKVLDAPAGAKMNEAAFWAVYKKSSMAQRHLKGSRRGAAVATEADAMFAQYHASVHAALKDEESERAALVDRSLDLSRFDSHRLAHVLEGHVLSGEAPRGHHKDGKSTSSAGIGKSTGIGGATESRGLELMRRLNRHGAMVIDSSEPAWREDADEREHPLPDLEDAETPEYSRLMVESEQAFFAAQARSAAAGTAGGKRGRPSEGSSGGAPMEIDEDEQEAERMNRLVLGHAEVMSSLLMGWEPNLARLGHGSHMAVGILSEVLTAMRP